MPCGAAGDHPPEGASAGSEGDSDRNSIHKVVKKVAKQHRISHWCPAPWRTVSVSVSVSVSMAVAVAVAVAVVLSVAVAVHIYHPRYIFYRQATNLFKQMRFTTVTYVV